MLSAHALSGQVAKPDNLEGSLQDLSAPPSDRVVDFGEVFSPDSAAKKDLSRRLDDLYARYQFSVYYIVYSGVIGSNVSRKASEFRDRWLGADKEGLIFVCDTDLKRIAYALTKVDSFPLDGSNPTWKVTDREISQTMVEMGKIDTTGMDEEEYLGAVGLNLVDALESRLKPMPKAKGKNTGGILGAVAAAALLMGLAVWWISKKSGSAAEAFEKSAFPTIEIPNRLGAHFGGGAVSEISFQAPRRPSDS